MSSIHNNILKEWRRIPGFSLYEASTEGEIKTYNHYNKAREAIMKPAMDANGYMRTMLIGDDGKYHTVKVHRIVALTFIPNPDNKPTVNHINNIRNDNRAVNLEWATISEQMLHAHKYGNKSNRGEKNPSVKLTESQVIEIRKRFTYGNKTKKKGCITKRELAEMYGVSVAAIKGLLAFKTWSHLPKEVSNG